jgi:ADP-heptose:LPS heptosyltransferase
MKYICFFTKGHNGDIVHSKAFIQDIATQLDIPCLYHHLNNPKISEDLSTTFTQISPPDYYSKFIETEKIFFINTWLWPYLLDNSFKDVNIETNYHIYTGICNVLNERFNKNLKLKNIESYYPYIDFSKIEKRNIEKFVNSNSNKKVLFGNGPCLSGQSAYNQDLSDLVEILSQKYSDIIFIATKKFETESKNIVFTDDIIQINGCDLNEIGYLSTFCNLIIGRTSGPFCFSTIKENYNDENKIFYAFGHRIGDCFHGSIEIKAKYIFNDSENKEMIDASIDKTIQDYLV